MDTTNDPEKPKPRPLKIEAHLLAYLGDLLNHYEEAIRRIARQEAHHTAPLRTLSNAAPSPGDR